MQNPYGWWLPFNASTNHGIDGLIAILHWFMAILFFGWGIYLVYCLVKFKYKPGRTVVAVDRKFKLPVYLEVAIVFVEIVLLVFVSSPLWYKYRVVFPLKKDSVVIRIVAEQYAWNFHYPGMDGKFGRMELGKIDGTNPLGLDREDPDAKDDIVSVNELHIPLHRPILAQLSSKDVIHSFFIPVLRVKQDVIPGMQIPIWFEAAVTGEFEVACSQLCGLGHYRMKGRLFIDTPEQFVEWLVQQEKSLL
jgi:cytochrome c oxidase subunit II